MDEMKARSSRFRITLRRSGIGRPEKQKKVLRSLGLKKINQEKIYPDIPSVRGMIKKVSHLVQVEELEG